jgi:hypothetical protein
MLLLLLHDVRILKRILQSQSQYFISFSNKGAYCGMWYIKNSALIRFFEDLKGVN